MFQTLRAVFLSACFVGILGMAAQGQESQSLGDVARQARQQKQSKDTASKPAEPPKVLTEEDVSHHSEAAAELSYPHSSNKEAAGSASSSGGAKRPAEEWKSQIQVQKQTVSSLQKAIDETNDSIQFAPGNCVSGCVQWNEAQKRKQAEVERMRIELDTQKQHLQKMQDAARDQGYGSSVYDP